MNIAEVPDADLIEQALAAAARETILLHLPDASHNAIRRIIVRRLRLPFDFFCSEYWNVRAHYVVWAEYQRQRLWSPAIPIERLSEATAHSLVAKPNSVVRQEIGRQVVMPLVRRISRKRSASSSDEDDSERPKKVAKKFISNEFVDTDSDDSNAGGKPVSQKPSKTERKVEPKAEPIPKSSVDGDDSDLSSDVVDAPVSKPKSRKKSVAKPSKTSKEKSKTKSTSKSSDSSDPAAAEIKDLQSWLVKCGVRKVWSKELAPYDSSPAKIRHLKDMLNDVGLTGKFSVAKAARIKEQRELAAELQDVQENEKLWGEDVENPRGGGRSQRAAARAPKRQVLSESSSSEEEPDEEDDEQAEDDIPQGEEDMDGTEESEASD